MLLYCLHNATLLHNCTALRLQTVDPNEGSNI